MKHECLNLPERPAFMKVVDLKQQQESDDYTLHIENENLYASIIKLKKGGILSMDEEVKMEAKKIVVADVGFEDVYQMLTSKKENLDNEKQAEIDKAVEEINTRFIEEESKIDNCIRQVSHEEEIEVPVEEVVEDSVVGENNDDTVSY